MPQSDNSSAREPCSANLCGKAVILTRIGSLRQDNVPEWLDGNKRIVDGDNDGVATVDIGAYEYQP